METQNTHISEYRKTTPSFDLSQSINDLGYLFREKQGESRAQRARSLMGDALKDLSDQDIESCLTEFQFLIDSWLDEFETKPFEKTLKQLIKEG